MDSQWVGVSFSGRPVGMHGLRRDAFSLGVQGVASCLLFLCTYLLCNEKYFIFELFIL